MCLQKCTAVAWGLVEEGIKMFSTLFSFRLSIFSFTLTVCVSIPVVDLRDLIINLHCSENKHEFKDVQRSLYQSVVSLCIGYTAARTSRDFWYDLETD